MKKQSIWVFEWRKSVHYWWSYILFSPECKELTSMPDPLLYRWGVPPVVIRCVHWTMQMQMWVLQTWITALGLAIVMRSCKASKVWDRWLQFSNCSESWQASRQHCCWGAHQISNRYKHFNTPSCANKTLQDPMIRTFLQYWISPQMMVWQHKQPRYHQECLTKFVYTPVNPTTTTNCCLQW